MDHLWTNQCLSISKVVKERTRIYPVLSFINIMDGLRD